MNNIQKCRVCGSNDFYKEAGYFFCQTCQTQSEDIREEVFELNVGHNTRVRKTKIRQARSDKSGDGAGWTSWELYNFILIGLTDELIGLGVPSDIKMTILQLWATYLGKIEVAFISTKKKCVPKLAKRYNKSDAEIIYGKAQSSKGSSKRRRVGSSTNTSVISSTYQSEGSSSRELVKNKRLLINADYDNYLQSQASSGADSRSLFSQSVHSFQTSSGKSSNYEASVFRLQYSSHAKEETKKVLRLSKNVPSGRRTKYIEKHVSTKYAMGPNVITPLKLWAIIYIALRIHDQPIQIGDMLRYGREGHLSYYKLDHLLPPEINLTKCKTNFLSQNIEITHKGMRRIIASMAKLLGVSDLRCPDFQSLISRYCTELGLPRGIQLYAERLVALSPPKMTFDIKKSYIPNYEGRAIAFIVVVLKTLLALDDITEYHISRVAEKINREKMQHGKVCYRQENNSSDNLFHKTHKRIGGGECTCYENNVPCIIVHGGAGNFSDSLVIEKMTACKKAAINGYKKLLRGENAVDAVEAALWWLECDEFFNCSYGSVLNDLGKVQMDASMMDGSTFKCGSVAAVSDIEHPISLAKYVMNNFPNSIFVDEGAKQLAKHANLNWISEGNMVSPLARLAFNRAENGDFEAEVENQSLLDVDALTSSFGTVGCVAYDGFNIAAGTTTGGLNRKLVGRVGDTPFLGCGTYATRNVGCSLSGHGESIMKLGLSREIVEDVEHNLTPEESLHKHFTYMLKTFEKTGGGVVLQSNGRWATFFTSEKMPYAAIENDLITFGARLYEERREIVASERGLRVEKLFSFQEWQRYVECRKTILVHSHFPTKIKYSPDSHGIDDLYIKFLEATTSKADKKEPDTKNSRHFLPEELIAAMSNYVTRLNFNETPEKLTESFPPSLTPLHSYLQHLLNRPLADIPRVIRSDFFLTKVGYLTKPNSLAELATKLDIEIGVCDSNLHFVEKVVLPFEQPRMPSVEELKQLVDVQDDSENKPVKISETLNDYMHRNVPCKVKLDVTKQQYYNSIRSLASSVKNIDTEEFMFTETLPNGKLDIPDDSEDEDKEKDVGLIASINQEHILSGKKFCDEYNLQLSLAEKESVCKSDILKQIRLRQAFRPMRNPKGQFIKGKIPVEVEESMNDFSPKENDLIAHSTQISSREEMFTGVESVADEKLSTSGSLNMTINDGDIEAAFSYLDDYFNLGEISIFGENNDVPQENEKSINNTRYQLFRPFKDYWMHHCIFSRVKPKNFAAFEKSLPRNFRWVLNECAHVVEMPVEDLYEEICLIETYLAHVLKPSSEEAPINVDPIAKSQLKFTLSKW